MNEQLIRFLDKYGLEGGYFGGALGGINELGTVIEVPKDLPEDENINMDILNNWIYENSLAVYRGWDGKWDASGKIGYNKKTKCIEINSSETDDDMRKVVARIKFTLARFFTMDDLKRVSHVFIQTHNEEETTIRIHVENGPWTTSLDVAEKAIAEFLGKEISNFDTDKDTRYRLSGNFKTDQEVQIIIQQLINYDRSWIINLKTTLFTNKKEPLETDETFKRLSQSISSSGE